LVTRQILRNDSELSNAGRNIAISRIGVSEHIGAEVAQV
jgi:hypothetical protein